MKTAQRVAFATVVSTLVLVAVGALVRATGSGLGCPDWPLCHGGVVPPGDIGHEPIIEFTHRFVAAVVGLLVIATAVLAWRHYRNVPVALWAALIAVPLVGLQGFLGALTVWQELPPEIVATHLLTAMLVLTVEGIAAIAMFVGDPDRVERMARIRRAVSRPMVVWSIVALAWLAALIWIGGYMAESGATTACSGWPLCNGSVLPAADDQEVTHMIHRYLAAGFILPGALVVWHAWRQRRDLFWAAPMAVALVALYGAQVLVGAFNVWYTFPDSLTVTHTAVASLVWFVLSCIVVLAVYRPVTQPAPHAARPAEVPV